MQRSEQNNIQAIMKWYARHAMGIGSLENWRERFSAQLKEDSVGKMGLDLSLEEQGRVNKIEIGGHKNE